MRSILASLAALTLAATAADEPAKPIVAIYDLEGKISEAGQVEPSFLDLGGMKSERPLTLFDLTRSLSEAADDEDVKAVVVDIDDAELGLAQLQEIQTRLKAIRAAGKDVWLYSDTFSNATALLGSTANHFTLMPEGDVSFSGIHSETMYYKGLLDKLGVQADVIHIGDFKSYGEEYYRTGPSEYSQKEHEELIGGIYDQIVAAVSEGRKVSPDKVKELIDRGTFTAKEAKEAGLVDDLKYRTEFSEAIKAAYKGADLDHNYGLPDLDGPEIKGFFDVVKMLFKDDKSKNEKTDYIAVVALEGEISDASIEPVRAEILKLIKDEHAKALVLRVDSPGGSALSSEVLWEATAEWKKTNRPFVVSMGEVAASGGYYVSSGAEKIFAEPGTITGSIGVVGMKMVVGGALEKLGITTSVTQRGKNAGAMSMYHPYTEEETKLIRDSMLSVYGTFKKRVQDGRNTKLKGDLESLAGGRVYTGVRGLAIGLVDEIGGLEEAIAYAADKAGLDEADSRLVPEPKSLLEGLFSKPDKNDDDSVVRMGRVQSPIAQAMAGSIEGLQLATLPRPMREAVQHVLKRIEACEHSAIQMIGPDISIPLK
jgi:protease-4